MIKRKKLIRKRRIIAPEQQHLSYNWGFDSGFNIGFSKGFELGLEKGGWALANPFEGTSIIIPSFNQVGYLKDCIESIERYTPEPHEIIVVDNGSTDGTADYLRSLSGGAVRHKISEQNLGFAGGVNQGLMMARGSRLLFLNNDTIATEGWLSNLLACLHSNDKFGLVGPVTNYISGDQLIETTYSSLDEMHHFAKSLNRSDSEKWKTTGRLTGFCVLMTRDVFRRLGYLDEGFEIGNCEDDDYGFRARLLGLELIIAHDTFIHHVGSTTIKTLTPEQFNEVYSRNLAFYSSKWGETHSLLQETLHLWDGSPTRMNDLYPTHVIVQGTGANMYWIEQGKRFPLPLDIQLPATRLAQVDIKNWPLGDPLNHVEIAGRLAATSGRQLEGGMLADGALVQTADGKHYQCKSGILHRISTDWALQVWNLSGRTIHPITDAAKSAYREGLPIIAPPVIKAHNI
ncbi:MAG: glycosyl transferase family 2 [Paenibacillus sp.]|nr:glycosyl transferase family 2 [Paenibacillus sp.]